jgi:hypothetical protein
VRACALARALVCVQHTCACMSVCVCVCVCVCECVSVCVSVRARACVCVCVSPCLRCVVCMVCRGPAALSIPSNPNTQPSHNGLRARMHEPQQQRKQQRKLPSSRLSGAHPTCGLQRVHDLDRSGEHKHKERRPLACRQPLRVSVPSRSHVLITPQGFGAVCFGYSSHWRVYAA